MSGAPRGEAANYYDQSKQYIPPQGPPPNGQQFGQAPPQYGQKYSNGTEDGYTVANGEKPSFDQAFKLQGPKYHDLWAGILLILVFLGFAAVSGISIRGYAVTKGFNGGGIYDSRNDFALDTNTLVLFVFCLAVAFVLSLGYMWLARAFTKQFIWITGILNIIFGFATSIYMLSRRYWSGGIVFLIFSIFVLVCFLSWRPRIPFSVLMLQTSIDVSKKYGHVYLVSLLGGIAATAFGAWYSVTLVSIYTTFEPGDNPACSRGVGGCSTAKVIGLIVFVTFAAYWISEWIKNTIHTTIAGVYGSWYFCSRNFPSNATRGAFRRATTYSFGSISLGSLLVAIVNSLRQLCSVAQRSEGMQGNVVGYIMFCILQCLIFVLQWAIQFINRYAFCHIALYGKSYIAAAKDTWKLLTQRGMDALVNELLIGPVLTMGATFIGYACALLAYLYVLFTDPEYNRDGSYTPVIVAFAFLIGLQICNIFTTPLASGVETIFVAAAWDPEVMMRDHPDLYARMIAVYPQVQQAIHV